MSEYTKHQKIGQNAPCLCGSGKKFKKCCWQSEDSQETNVVDFAWEKIRQTSHEVFEHLMEFAERIPQKAYKEASLDFAPFQYDIPDEMYEEISDYLFTMWLLYSWEPKSLEPRVTYGLDKPIALKFLESKGASLSEYQQRFIRATLDAHYSFYVAVDATRSKELTLEDIFLGNQVRIKGTNKSTPIARGEILYCSVTTLDGKSVLGGLGPYVLPPIFHPLLLNEKDELEKKGKLTASRLKYDFSDKLRELFFRILEEVMVVEEPMLSNTDGHPVVFCTVYFKLKIDSITAYKKLRPLFLSKSADDSEFIDLAEKNGITVFNMPWFDPKKQKNGGHTLLGEIAIKKNVLSIEVNSVERAQVIIQLVRHYLGDQATYKNTMMQSVEQSTRKLQQTKAKLPFPPEMAAHMEQFSKQHWKEWFVTKIPALNNVTPRQAARSKIGRKRLEALLLDYERRDESRSPDDPFRADLDYLRSELGLITETE